MYGNGTSGKAISDFDPSSGAWTERAEPLPHFLAQAHVFPRGRDVFFFFWRYVMAWNGTTERFEVLADAPRSVGTVYLNGMFPLETL